MTMPPHLAHLVNASLEVERARRSLDDEARQYAHDPARNYTVDGARNYTVDGMSIDALMKAGRKGVAILVTDSGFDIVPLGDVETNVREAEPGHPERWEKSYEQISGENFKEAAAKSHKRSDETKGRFEPQQGEVAAAAALAQGAAADAALLVQQNALAEIKAHTDAAKRDKMVADQQAWSRAQYDRTARVAQQMKEASGRMWPKGSPVSAPRTGR